MRSQAERLIAKKLRSQKKTYKQISETMNISIDSARNLTRDLQYFKKKRGTKNIIDSKYKMRIKRNISLLKVRHEKVNSRKLIDNCELPCSKRTVQRFMKRENLKYINVRHQIKLSKADKENRYAMASKWLSENHDWEKTVFTDEKVFSLDGPSAWKSYVKENDENIRNIRVCGGGKVMVWLICFPNGLLWFNTFTSNFNSLKYIALLKDKVLKLIKLNLQHFFYQEDNSRIHKSNIVKQFMEENDIHVIKWPVRSPDLNIVEDIWKILSDKVYDGPQFSNKRDLEHKIRLCVDEINKNERASIMNLYSSMRSRLLKVIVRKGNLSNRKA